jgi:two-component system sensor histidine kinase/response regulator
MGARCDTFSSLGSLLVHAGDQAPWEVLLVSGAAALEKQLPRHAALKAVRVVLLSEKAHRPEARNWEESGFSRELLLPIRLAPLIRTLEELLGTRSGVEADRAADSRAAAVIPEAIRATTRILVADDNAVNQKVAVKLIERLGYAADCVANGKEALEALGMIPYDLVFMDCEMPEMDGYEATRAIRHMKTPAPGPVIIAMTANALKGDRERCLKAGMNDYVAKPIRADELSAVIERWLSKRHTQQHAQPAAAFREPVTRP